MLFGRTMLAGAAMAALTIASAVAQTSDTDSSSASTTATTNTVTRSESFPAVGLGSTETMQVNLVNLATLPTTTSTTTTTTTTTITPTLSCTGSVSFMNASGAAIGTATQFTLSDGQIFSAKLPFTGANIAGTRGEVRAVVSITRTPGSGAVCALSSSLETYDTTTGATHVFLAGPLTNGGGHGFGGF